MGTSIYGTSVMASHGATSLGATRNTDRVGSRDGLEPSEATGQSAQVLDCGPMAPQVGYGIGNGVPPVTLSVTSAQPDRAGGQNGSAPSIPDNLRLVVSGPALATALLEVVQGAQEHLVAAGSRSREPGYLREIEQVLRERPCLVHHRMLIGDLHSQVLKDHLFRLFELRSDSVGTTLSVSIVTDTVADSERFFVANEHAAVVLLPSATSPSNFDTALVVHDARYARGLVQHGIALSGTRLDTVDAVGQLEVLR